MYTNSDMNGLATAQIKCHMCVDRVHEMLNAQRATYLRTTTAFGESVAMIPAMAASRFWFCFFFILSYKYQV